MTKVIIVVCALMVMVFSNMVLYRRNPVMREIMGIVGWWPFNLVEALLVCYIAMMLTIMFG